MKTKAETHEQEIHVWAVPRTITEKNARPFSYDLWINDSGHWCTDAVFVCSSVVKVSIPDGIDLIEKAVETLKQQASDIRTEANSKVAKIEKRISGLLLIEHQPESDDESEK